MMINCTNQNLSICLFSLICFLYADFAEAQVPKSIPCDIVFCLDLSGSTNGLINDVRDNLWLIINQVKLIKPDADLRIAVVGFSRPSFGKNNAYVKVLADLTDNFDFVSAQLFRLKPSIEKGDQYINAAISTCISQLSWSKENLSKKIIFIVGNGNAKSVEYIKTCELASSKQIIINPIYVPNGASIIHELPAWRRIATITGGIQEEITVNKIENETVWTEVKFDRIREINNKLNASYRWSGSDGDMCRRVQLTADSGAFFTSKDAFCNRIFFKLDKDYSKSISNCELTYSYTNVKLANIKTTSDSTKQIVDEFQNRLNTILNDRQKLINALEVELPRVNQENLKVKYDSEILLNQNIFHRVVINTLRKQL